MTSVSANKSHFKHKQTKNNAPKLLTGMCLLLWGWQHEILWAAIPMAVAAEAHSLIKARFDIKRKELNILFDMCAVFFAGILIYGIISASGSKAIFLLILWLPIVLFPMLLVQRYSSHWDLIPMTTISFKARKANQTNRSIDISFLYIAAILLSASSSNITPIIFYIFICLVLFISSWKLRGNFFPKWAFILIFPFAAAGGFIMDSGIVKAQLYIENQIGSWFLSWFKTDADPFRRETRIGDIGLLKGSGQIIHRITTDKDSLPPKLIRNGTFDILIGKTWKTSNKDFFALKRNGFLSWSINQFNTTPVNNLSTKKVTISSYSENNSILSIPLGALTINNIPAEKIEQTLLGTLKATNTSNFLNYEITYYEQNSAAIEYNHPPKIQDMQIPSSLTQSLNLINSELNLNDKPPKEVIESLKRFFSDNFSYSLKLHKTNSVQPPLIDFLQNTKSGHCEYFATATTLLLRQAGIPARYATGFSIQEYDDFEGAWLAREHHAHAWALAYIDGRWINIDNTPPAWLEEDREEDSVLLSIYNVLSWVRFAYNKRRMSNEDIISDPYIYFFAAIMAVFIAYRINKRRKKTSHSTQTIDIAQDSNRNPWKDFFISIEDKTVPRNESETLFDWLSRCSPSLNERQQKRLRGVIVSYYRYRFDPSADKGQLEEDINRLISEFSAK